MKRIRDHLPDLILNQNYTPQLLPLLGACFSKPLSANHLWAC